MPFNRLRRLGLTGIDVSPVTLGTSFLGNPAQPDGTPAPEAYGLAREMLASRFAAVDTSNNYAQGRSETVLGGVLREGVLQDGHLVITKADADPVTGHFDRDRVWRSFEESTQRLGLEKLPLFHLHDPFALSFEEAFAPGGAVQGMTELKDQGLVGAIGIAAGEITPMRQFVGSGVFDAVLTHNRYTIVDRRAEDLLQDATERGMGVFNAAPFGGGLLAGKGTSYAYRESPAALLEWLDKAKALCAEWSLELPAVALQFSLNSPLIHSTVVGVNRPERLEDLQRLQSVSVPPEFWTELEKLGTPPSTIAD